MTLDGDMSVKDLLIQACKRIDGITMYAVCIFFAIFAIYATVAQQVGATFVMSYSKGKSSALLVPVVFAAYVYLSYFSVSGKVSRILNALILLFIPILFFYKSFH